MKLTTTTKKIPSQKYLRTSNHICFSYGNFLQGTMDPGKLFVLFLYLTALFLLSQMFTIMIISLAEF